MDNTEYSALGHIGSAKVGVQPTLDGQDILIEHGDLGQRLACLLACGNTEIVRRGEVLYWRVHYSPEVDRLLMDLTDMFISIRYAHPTLVQLELELDACTRAAGLHTRAAPPGAGLAVRPRYASEPAP